MTVLVATVLHFGWMPRYFTIRFDILLQCPITLSLQRRFLPLLSNVKLHELKLHVVTYYFVIFHRILTQMRQKVCIFSLIIALYMNLNLKVLHKINMWYIINIWCGKCEVIWDHQVFWSSPQWKVMENYPVLGITSGLEINYNLNLPFRQFYLPEALLNESKVQSTGEHTMKTFNHSYQSVQQTSTRLRTFVKLWSMLQLQYCMYCMFLWTGISEYASPAEPKVCSPLNSAPVVNKEQKSSSALNESRTSPPSSHPNTRGIKVRKLLR